jgi:hypothetical protein
VIERSAEFIENLVATGVDMLSISVAYQLGINQSGLVVGFLYAVLDAYVVIWQRKRLTRLMHQVASGLSGFLNDVRQTKKTIGEVMRRI